MDNQLDYLAFLVRDFESSKHYLSNTVAYAQLELISNTIDEIISIGKGHLIPPKFLQYKNTNSGTSI